MPTPSVVRAKPQPFTHLETRLGAGGLLRRSCEWGWGVARGCALLKPSDIFISSPRNPLLFLP